MANKQFLEADKVQAKIKRLKAKQLKSHKVAIRSRQSSDIKILDESHEKEIEELDQLWKAKFKEYKHACRQGEEELKQKQAEAYESEKERLSSNLPIMPRVSSEILNLQKIQEAVIKQKEFREAHTLQMQLDSLAEGTQEKWMEERNEKINRSLAQLTKRHESELKNYRARALSGFNELKKQKEAELDALRKRYHNARQELSSQQKLENSRLEMSMRVTENLSTVSKMMSSRTERFTPQASLQEF